MGAMKARLALVAAVLSVLAGLSGCAGPAPTCGPGDPACLRILFIGNSYTYVNDLPGMFTSLARSKGRVVEVQSLASGGATLNDHLSDPATNERLDAMHWDYVVLQEQSTVPAVADSAEYWMFPAARSLVARIRERGEKPLFFMTWGHRDGDYYVAGYEPMQNAVTRSYLSIAGELEAPVAPVGSAWFTARRTHSEIDLWQSDGSHPSTAGTYLAACVFYATVFLDSPVGASYDAGLGSDTAGTLRGVAAETVLANPAQWGLRGS
jgi:hypothetical protein